MNNKQRVLLTGLNSVLIESLYAELEKDFTLCCGNPETNELCGAAAAFRPDAVLICLNGDGENEYKAYENLRYLSATYEKPLLAIGTEEEKQRLSEAINDSRLFFVNTLNNPSLLIYRIKDVIFNCDARDIDVFKAKEVVVEDVDSVTLRPVSRRPHILIIDDELKYMRLFKADLTPKYSVTAVSSVEMAFEVLGGRNHVDIVLLDYSLGGVTAPRIVERLKRTHEYRLIPIIILVKMSDPMELDKTFSFEPDGYYIKPPRLPEKLGRDASKKLDTMIIGQLIRGCRRFSAKLPE